MTLVLPHLGMLPAGPLQDLGRWTNIEGWDKERGSGRVGRYMARAQGSQQRLHDRVLLLAELVGMQVGETDDVAELSAPQKIGCPTAISVRGRRRITRPAASVAPRMSSSERKPAMFLVPRLQTHTTRLPTSSAAS